MTITDRNFTRKVLLSCIIGTSLEWYDFVIYGYFAAIFGSLFFPQADPITQMLASWGIFWSGFLARPLGSVVFGHIGDKFSRKHALVISLIMMAIPTTLMGLLPTYDHVGIVAPLLLIILRTFQGFAIGGEFTGSMVFLVEHAPDTKRGLWGSWSMFSAVAGVILGSCLIAGLNFIISSEQMYAWGWRLPFLISLLGSFVGIYMRQHLSDPKIYLEMKARESQEKFSLKELFLSHHHEIIVIIFLDFLTAVGFFIIAVFLATYFRTYLFYPENVALLIHTISMVILACAILLGGWLSDHIGRKPLLWIACVGFIVFSYPLFQLLRLGNVYFLLVGEGTLAFMLGCFLGGIPATLAEILPTNVRFAGVSIAHNTCMAVVGGGTPFVASHLIYHFNNLSIPAALLIAAAVVSLCAVFFIKEKHRHSL